MKKGEGTRSGLLWEVERLLNENDILPQLLLMENVTQVHNGKNLDDFEKWIKYLENKGYSNFYRNLNSKYFGAAQNRDRCFMVSILGDYRFAFPKPRKLERTMNDYLEENVDEKYYINNEKSKALIDELMKDKTLIGENQAVVMTNMVCKEKEPNAEKKDIAHTLLSRDYKGLNNSGTNRVIETKIKKIGNIYGYTGGSFQGNVYDVNGISPTLNTMQGGHRQPMIVIGGEQKNQAVKKDGICTTLTSSMGTGGGYVPMIIDNPVCLNLKDEISGKQPSFQDRVYDTQGIATSLVSSRFRTSYLMPTMRIRKLTPKECFRLMGFDDESFQRAAEVNSNTQLYKQAGNSIVVDVLVAIFNISENFTMRIGENDYYEKKEAGSALLEACRKIKGISMEMDVGKYKGFSMKAKYDIFKESHCMC